ncbi:prorelaxin H2 precursor [Pan troglodytes]|uniref:Relaxin 2 n=1 Tax=Pan troglodytes TaxID=9598 RepID=B1AAP5_PANTR|nr:prorelaxin H2 precursor [Pan troglodytes]ACA13573.1 relaxin 2 [Pan troglodytes]
MPRLFFFHLLGVCLLLNQFSRAVADSWMDEVIKLCGRELVRAQIAICGMSSWGKRSLSQEDAPQTPRPVAEIVPSFINKDTETINMMSEFVANLPQELKLTLSEMQPALPQLQQYVPVLKDSSLLFEEFKKLIRNRQSEAADSSPSELKYLGLDTHSRKKRQLYSALANKCCHVGCTKRSLARFC